jgi:hypothetical protein
MNIIEAYKEAKKLSRCKIINADKTRIIDFSYKNAKTSAILAQYTLEQIQEMLNSGEFKYNIAEKLGVYTKAFNAYIEKHNLTYIKPDVSLTRKGMKYNVRRKRNRELIAIISDELPDKEAFQNFQKEFSERKQKRMIKELNNGVYD